jgi:capsular exopolysaccharide synthesis family protein
MVPRSGMNLVMDSTGRPPHTTLDLRALAGVLWYRKWSILLSLAILMGTALYFTSQQTPAYSSSALVLITPSQTSTNPQVNPSLNLQTETHLAASHDVAALAADSLGGSVGANDLLSGLSVTVEPGTEILRFGYVSSDPSTAQVRADALARAYLDYRREQTLENLQAAALTVKNQIHFLNKRLNKVEENLSTTTDQAEQATQQAEADSLSGQITLLKSQLLLLTGPGGLQIGQVVATANLPSLPFSPSYRRNLGLALVLGVGLGLTQALVRDRLDARLHDPIDAEQALRAPVLASVPHISTWRKRSRALLIMAARPQSVHADCYRTLRTSVMFAASQHDVRLILITSPNPQEGKTATTANLGVALAQAGKRVIVVGADLRTPRLAEFLSSKPPLGLSSILSGPTSLQDALVPTAYDGLLLLDSGPISSRPTELLGSERMGKLLAELREIADYVLIDSAPVLAAADAITLAPLVDSVLFVADGSRTTAESLVTAREQLSHVEARLLGAVLNNFDSGRSRRQSSHAA